MVRKFLYFVAACIVLGIVALVALRIWTRELAELAFVPSGEFVQEADLDQNAYANAGMWFSHPNMQGDDPAKWQPSWRGEAADAVSEFLLDDKSSFALFFVHPTSFFDRSRWNAPIGDKEAERVARIYLRGMASPFNHAHEIWAPRYRQATFGAYLSQSSQARMAFDLAYRDVAQAFAAFIAGIDPDRPIIIAGHSQGSMHLLRLLREHIAGSPLEDRMIAAYLVGWPISIAHDLPEIGIPACSVREQTGCMLSWSSFAEPADPSMVLEPYASSTGFDGQLRTNSAILCTNPINGTVGGIAAAEENLGTLFPDGDLSNGYLKPHAVPARCDPRGLLLIGDPPEMGSYVLPGNDYHVYDIPLFWANVQRDITQRAKAWEAEH